MSVIVSDLLELPSLRQAKVLAGHKGMTRIVSSISVLESTDPSALKDEIFPQGEFYGGEIVITGFLNCIDNIDCQCANIRRLAEGGEVGLILFYVGIYLPKVDQKLIDLANELDFVLISMPEGQTSLRYSEVIKDVTDCIYRNRAYNDSVVADILARMSSLPQHLQTINTVLRMLSDLLSASVVLSDSFHNILNLVAWPRGLESEVKEKIEMEQKELPADSSIYHLPIQSDNGRNLELMLLVENAEFNEELLSQAADVVRICVNIWGKKHEEVAIHELFRAILQDEPLKMRRLAEIFHINVANIHEMWILSGCDEDSQGIFEKQVFPLCDMLKMHVDTVVGDMYEGQLLLLLSTPRSLQDAEQIMHEILENFAKTDKDITLTRCACLQNTQEVRQAYLCHRDHLDDVKKIYPFRRNFNLGDVIFGKECRELIEGGEDAVSQCTAILGHLRTENEEVDLVNTLCTYLLDGNSSVTQTSKLLYIHTNTVKYRVRRMADLLGFRVDKMPEAARIYQAAAVFRLLN